MHSFFCVVQDHFLQEGFLLYLLSIKWQEGDINFPSSENDLEAACISFTHLLLATSMVGWIHWGAAIFLEEGILDNDYFVP